MLSPLFAHRSLPALLGFTLLLCLAGCGDSFPNRYPVSGTVTFSDGSPVMTGTLEVGSPGSKWTASGKIERDGRFELTTVNPGDGAIEGEHRVILRQLVVTYIQPTAGHDHGRLVDPKYADYSTSPLRLTVPKGGLQDAKLVVEPKP